MIKSLILGGAGICAFFLMKTNEPRADKVRTFVLSDTGSPVSTDPLDADYFSNLHASQMIHRTLLEVNSDNTLTSTVLKSFTYDAQAAEIVFVLADHMTFSDGSPIRPEDVALAVQRMAAKRPDFPVLRHIVGIKEWASRPNPLSQTLPGIRIEGRSVKIKLSRDLNEPLYRFALPLFGVVKSECVDLTQNKIKPGCPTSGPYILESTDSSIWTFKLITPPAQGASPLANRIQIRFVPEVLGAERINELNLNEAVVVRQEYRYDAVEESALRAAGYVRVEQPNSRFSVFLLNPKNEAFRNPAGRRFFADTVRRHLKARSGHLQLEASLFSRILPGYLTSSELHDGETFSTEQSEALRSAFRHTKLRWMPTANNNGVDFESALYAAASELGITIEVLPEESPKERFEAFTAGRLDVLLGGSGFWAFDPVGDLQMLLTPGLHPPLSFVVSDPDLQVRLRDLEFEKEPTERLRDINRYVFRQGLMNVFAHSKRVYLVKSEDTTRSIPIAITPPAPWQVFRGESY